MYFSAENLHSQEVSPVMMNYKMTHNKNRPARDSLVWPDHFPLLIFVVAEKRKDTVCTCEATCKCSHGGRLAQCVS